VRHDTPTPIAHPREYFDLPSGKRGDADFVLSRGGLWDFTYCPQCFRLGGRYVDSDATGLKKGSMLDCLLLTPDLWDEMFVVSPWGDGPFSRGEKADWKREQFRNGMTPYKPKERAEAEQMAERLRQHVIEAGVTLEDILAVSETQVMLTHLYRDDDSDTGIDLEDIFAHHGKPYLVATGLEIPLKILVDIAPKNGNALFDLKGLRWPDPSKFERAVQWDDFGISLQAGMYTTVWNWATCQDRSFWGWPVCGNEKPYLPANHALEGRNLAIAQERFLIALREYCHAVHNDKWPGLTTGWNRIELRR